MAVLHPSGVIDNTEGYIMHTQEYYDDLVKYWIKSNHVHADYILSDGNAIARWCADFEDNGLIEIPARDSVIRIPVTLTK